jgi:hypothetical protein
MAVTENTKKPNVERRIAGRSAAAVVVVRGLEEDVVSVVVCALVGELKSRMSSRPVGTAMIRVNSGDSNVVSTRSCYDQGARSEADGQT